MAAVYAFVYIFIFLIAVSYIENFRKFNRIIFPLEQEVKKFLPLYFSFYRKLSFRKRILFEKKVKLFLNSFEYRVKRGLKSHLK